MRIFLGIIGIILSFLIIIYRVQVKRFTGNFEWAEAKLGSGGTYTVLLLVGIVCFFLSLTYMMDGFGLFLDAIGIEFFGAIN